MSAKRLAGLLDSFAGKRVIVFGDVMLDRFVRGTAGRISPEAPVPVVRVEREDSLPGGAGNVAVNLADLDARAVLVSVCGDDSAAAELDAALGEKGVDTSGVLRDPLRPTTEKVRVIAEHQQVVRFDREAVRPLSHGIARDCLENFKKTLKTAHAVVLSDYGKGMLSPAMIRSVIAECLKAGVPVCVDPKEEHFKKYRRVSCITPNTKEAWGGMGLNQKEGGQNVDALGGKILKSLGSRSVLITQGPGGMTLFERGKKPLHIPAAAREVYDVTGAGDTVISVFAMALACRAGFADAAILANYAAGIVVGKLGTASASRAELREAIK